MFHGEFGRGTELAEKFGPGRIFPLGCAFRGFQSVQRFAEAGEAFLFALDLARFLAGRTG